ncbi:MAG: CDP-alcohol phosphatidyltransferase family protein [Actinomycetota bacterium]|nr:CDP-alcohol phosphatidyltransferase family protein [Actinomycetota bacterium]
MNASQSQDAPAASRRLLTVPNVLSALRLATVPVFVTLFVSGRTNEAVILYGCVAWTDFFDGLIARRLRQVSELGKLLDPLADRIFILALTGMLVARGALAAWLAAIIIARDLLILLVYPTLERRGIPRIPVNFAGKTATALLLFGLTWLAVSETTVSFARAAHAIGFGLTLAGAAFYWVAAILYAREMRSRAAALRRSGDPG